MDNNINTQMGLTPAVGVHGMISLSESSPGTLESILPVQIQDPNLERNYSFMLYPRRKPSGGYDTRRAHYSDVFHYLAQVSAVANAVLAQLRYLYNEFPTYAASGSPKDMQAANILSTFERIQNALDGSVLEDTARATMGAIALGKSHIIRPSERYKGGMDVMFTGVPNGNYGGTSNVWYRPIGTMYQLPQYETQMNPVAQNSPLREAVLRMGAIVSEWMTGSSDFGAEDRRHVVGRPIKEKTFDVSALQSALDSEMRTAGFAGFGKIQIQTDWPEKLQEGLSEFFTFSVVREPNHRLLNARERYPGAADHGLTKGSGLLQAEYGLSITMNLQPEIVSFITQTPKGGKPPLAALNTWVNVWARAVIRVPRSSTKGSGTDRVLIGQVPRYILMPSKTSELEKRRKELGLFTEKGRTNEDGIFISDTGRFNYCPPASDIASENARAYEKLQEEALEVSFAAGSPMIASQTGYASPYFATVDQDYREKIKGLKSDLSKYAGSLQTYSWDYNCILTSSASDPDRLISTKLEGATTPDELALSEYLTKPAAEALSVMFPRLISVNADTYGGAAEEIPSGSRMDNVALRTPDAILGSNLIVSLVRTYSYLLYDKKVPDLQTLVDRAAKALDIKTLDPSKMSDAAEQRKEDPAHYDVGLYNGMTRFNTTPVVQDDLKVVPNIRMPAIPSDFKYDKNDPKSESQFKGFQQDLVNNATGIVRMLRAALNDAAGTKGSNMLRINMMAGTNFEDDNHYYDPAVHNLGDFQNVFNYLGGRVFYEALQALMKVDPKELMVVNLRNPMPMPDYPSVVKDVMPFTVFIGKYVPDREKINEKAEEISEGLKADNSISTDDIHLPGSKQGFQMFPHQAEAFKTLARRPRYATLDIAPGGGKTILGLTDIGNLIHAGLIKRPCVLAPNGLVRNWIEDMHSVTDGNWNLIPITTATYRTWGEERLTKLIQTAPINTIFVVGLSFLRLLRYQVVIGNHVERMSATLEFCKKFGFDYIILDESHKAKNMKSQTHRAIKQLTVSSSVKYIRLATGTLIQTKLTDVVGQAALYGSHIFRTAEEYEAENSVRVGDSRATVFASDTPYRARQQLSKHSAVISFKKKEWAFLLPRPIESFISVALDAGGDELGQAHQMMYDAILKVTLEEIKGDKTVMKLLSGGEEDNDGPDDDDDGDDAEDGATRKSGKSNAVSGISGLPIEVGEGMDDSMMEDLENALRPYLQRLEMLLTDPLGDQFGEKFFKGMKKENYVSRKVKKIIERIQLNFEEQPWEKGRRYMLKDLCDYKGVRYVLMGEPGKKLTLESYREDYLSVKAPDQDPRWKPEPFGKVIVFCRYTRSVNAIYRALPPQMKKLAVKFSGEEANKWQNLEDFRLTPFSKEKGVQIFIANEQAIAEGHNLQMASRIVRSESPWSPGELDQSSSRIFRPDTTGQFRRENVYLDWVLCNNTMEVAKVGRLISRMIDKTKFDEANNPLYDELEELELPPISMSLETIAAKPMLRDIQEYMDGYQQLVRIQSSEFEEMRQTKPSNMFPIEPTPMPKGSAILEQVPYLPTLKSVPDRHNYGLHKLTTYLADSDSPEAVEVQNDKQKLIGMYAHTEFGNGVIIGIREMRSKTEGGQSRLSTVTVQLVNGDRYDADPAMIYLALNLTKETVGNFSPKGRMATKTDKVKAEKEEKERLRQERIENRRAEREQKRLDRQAIREKKLKDAENAKTKVKRSKRAAAPVEDDEEEEEVISVDLWPAIYNGFMAVEATPGEDDEKYMKKMGFKHSGAYAYLQIKDKISFDALMVWLEKKFYLRSETSKRLHKLADSFVSGRGRKFNIEMAPVADLKMFNNIKHKLSGKDKASGLPELKLYPVIMDGALLLNVDIATNPVIRKYLGKVIPGTKNLKFEEADEMWIQFFNSRQEVVNWTKGIRKEGYEITNYEEFKERVDELKDKLRYMQKLAK